MAVCYEPDIGENAGASAGIGPDWVEAGWFLVLPCFVCVPEVLPLFNLAALLTVDLGSSKTEVGYAGGVPCCLVGPGGLYM